MAENVLITGGSGGIGAAIVKLFSAEGYNIAFGYNSSEESAIKLSRETGAVAIKADLSIEHGTRLLADRARETLGSIDVLINNAAISLSGLFTDITDGEMLSLFNINLFSAMRLSKLLLPDMIRKKNGRIINISSVWGIVGASCEVDYSVSKAGLIGLTKALAKEVAPSGIKVNCIAPGVVDTPMNSCYTDDDMKALCDEIPLGRLGAPEEIAQLALFLVSSKSDYITGQIISPNGGFVI